jgi:putative membrane protein
MANTFLARAAVASLVLSSTLGLRQVAAQQAGLTADSSFIATAGSRGLLQAKLGKLAQDKGSSPSVKDFGSRMATDYAKANEQLAAGAKQAAFPAQVILRADQQVFDLLSRTGRGSFDKKFVAEIVKQDSEAVRLFQQEAETGRVASLKRLASEMLPTVQQHLSLATETARSVGADVTASASTGRQGS